jgi:hypothetical protein
MTREEMRLIFSVVRFDCDHIENILGCDPDNYRQWERRLKKAKQSRDILIRELVKDKGKIRKR